ncbi:MAG: M20/M25/M40 family metallo-hydrolase [Planctomycetaceae bacterium]|nr:M20/M25/M40 family metallo-hydrolase [Planctomycetaceae bacterium]
MATIVSWLCCWHAAVSSAAEKKKLTPSQQRLANSVQYLADDEREGRGVGTKGLDMAADYIAKEFSKLGLKTDLYAGKPYQEFSLVIKSEMGPAKENQLALQQKGSDATTLSLAKHFTPLAIGGSAKISAPLVFVGYGITAPKLKYDDYAGLDVKGKVVIILRKEPQQNNPHSLFDGTNPSRHALFVTKVSNAFQHGAAAVILINDHQALSRNQQARQQSWDRAVEKIVATHQAHAKIEKPDEKQKAKYREEIQGQADNIQNLGAALKGDGDSLLPFTGAGVDSKYRNMPVYFCLRSTIAPLIKQATKTDLVAIEKKIDETLEPQSTLLGDWTATGKAQVVAKRATVKNVIGVLEAEGPLAHETIIVGAHYDHLGMGGQGSLAPWTKEIHNGADDNASGTASLLEVAHRLAQPGFKPKRRIVFIAFSGEERGLLGSARYVREPRFSLEDTVAMVNMDMVGRLTENKLIIQGTQTADMMEGLIDKLNKTYEFDLTKKPGGMGPSDHQSFYLKGIPVLHMFTGLHSNYHRPSDDFNLLNLEGMDRITHMVVDIVQQIDALPKRPKFQKSEVKRNVTGGGGDRPYFGSIPDYSDDAEGLPLTGVSPGGPAEKAGFKPKDIIIKLGKYKIGGIEDFDSALRKFKGGDKVPVTVLRKGKPKMLTITLGNPR